MFMMRLCARNFFFSFFQKKESYIWQILVLIKFCNKCLNVLFFPPSSIAYGKCKVLFGNTCDRNKYVYSFSFHSSSLFKSYNYFYLILVFSLWFFLCLNIQIFMVLPAASSPRDVLHQGYFICLSSLYLLLFLVHLDTDTVLKPIT